MHVYVILHLNRNRESYEFNAVQSVLQEFCSQNRIEIVRAPTGHGAMHDISSDVCVYARCAQCLHKKKVTALRWAAHHRHKKDADAVKQQLLCDWKGLDESRIRKSELDRRRRDRDKRRA